MDTFNHARSQEEKLAIIESFSYIPLNGPIRMQDAQETFVVHELWSRGPTHKLLKIYLGRFVILAV
jgi:hypothetical protein